MENKEIMLKPVVSEKSYGLANASNKYVFFVDTGVNKIEIKKAVEKKYKVTVLDVNTVVKPGKGFKDWKSNKSFRKSDKRKAIVTLKKGDKIDEFLNI
ncbi:MAG: 50S ribosomal protein L23 [Candidatus Dojkabacteria bacterium]|jgi:large subunit ribosomal protein L23|uniref:Large ribosomal subunit protein uL23 n=2 Tax=Candidatus Dojkabacteria TaxID=74243 RepID=A0A1F4UIK8_9BACT|nr:50S ribosomal protein L23 [Candidatus Dojkabacteria bacterium]OGC44161.1 MAG: 50S ribosomal protein L23 [candidate division WS6 bacterium RIFOXYC1_FULL_33_10]OGC44702.1 MAG: 50S ribosomal protein L23 [candidate division WS6 bacterium RIFOXYB1_FULL_33_14]